jgi:hypothetical protein
MWRYPQAAAVASVVRLYWWDSDASVLRDAWGRFAAVLALQLARSKASAWLSLTTRLQLTAWELSLKSPHGGGNPNGRGDRGASSRVSVPVVIARAIGQNLLAVALNVLVDKLYQRVLLSLRMRWSKSLTAHLLQHYLVLNRRTTDDNESSGLDRAEQHLAYDVDKVGVVLYLLAALR